jgi:tRNA(fMet)-specific endonuclease VapC
MIHFDTSFLIDLGREVARDKPASAFEFVESLDPGDVLSISVHVVCELQAGAELSRRPLRELEAVDELLSGFLVAYPDDRFAPLYGRLLAAASRAGATPAATDLLIGTAALVDDAPLVTRNVKDFSRIPGLRLLPY